MPRDRSSRCETSGAAELRNNNRRSLLTYGRLSNSRVRSVTCDVRNRSSDSNRRSSSVPIELLKYRLSVRRELRDSNRRVNVLQHHRGSNRDVRLHRNGRRCDESRDRCVVRNQRHVLRGLQHHNR